MLSFWLNKVSDGVCDPSTLDLASLYIMKLGKYAFEAYASTTWWKIALLPSLEVSYDMSGIYLNLSFLFFEAYLSVVDEVKEKEWTNKYFEE